MTGQVNRENSLLDVLYEIEKSCESISFVRVPKKGPFSFGRQKTVCNNNKKSRVAKVVLGIKLCNAIIPYALKKPEEVKDAKATIGRIAQKLHTAEYALISKQKKPTSNQLARMKIYAKLKV